MLLLVTTCVREDELRAMGANKARSEKELSQIRDFLTTHASDAAKKHSSELSKSRQENEKHMHHMIHDNGSCGPW